MADYTSILVALGTLLYAGATIVQVRLMNESGKHTDEQIGRISGNASWMARSMDQSVRDSEFNNRQITQNAERSIKATEDQTRLDQRAWVGFSDITTKYGVGSQAAGSVIINNGRTPARNIHAIIAFGEISRTGELNALDERWMRKVIFTARKTPFGRNEYLTNDPQGVGDRGGFIYLYEPYLLPPDIAGGIIHAPMAMTIGTLAPGEQYPLMGIGKPQDAGSDWSDEGGQKNPLVVFGFIGYTDIFNRPHVTTFCNERFAGPVDLFGRCPFYNDMK